MVLCSFSPTGVQELRFPVNEMNVNYDVGFAIYVRRKKLGSAQLNIDQVKNDLVNGACVCVRVPSSSSLLLCASAQLALAPIPSNFLPSPSPFSTLRPLLAD